MSILHVQRFEPPGYLSLLPNTDAGTVILAVDFNVEELACRAKIGDLVAFQDTGLNFNRSFCSDFVLHQ